MKPRALIFGALFVALTTGSHDARAQKPAKPPTEGSTRKPTAPQKRPHAAHKRGTEPKSPPHLGHASTEKGASEPRTTSPVAETKTQESPVKLTLDVDRFTLPNGLNVVFNVERTSPTVAVAVTYNVGSRQEEKGRSGFAHLFEHMMFQGSANVKKGDHFRLISSHGGNLNGTTSSDRTNYFEVLPSTQLELALFLEADRMKALDITQENFENQRSVVEEEFRMRISNSAYAPSSIRLAELVYQGYFPYEHPTIGSMADLDNAKLEWVRAFHKTHYGPNNAVLAIAGDFDPKTATEWVKKYFGPVPAIQVEPFREVPFPEQTSQRTAVLRDDNARTPGVLYGFAIPPFRTADHYALEIAATILGDGETSRLYDLLVREKSLVQSVSVNTEDRRGPDIFTIEAVLAEGVQISTVEKLIEGEVKRLSSTPPSEAELSKAHRRIESALVLGLQTNISRATKLAEYELFYKDARLLNEELSNYLRVTPKDVTRVALQYLGPTRRTIVEAYPRGKSDGPEAKKRSSVLTGKAQEEKAVAPSGETTKAKLPKGAKNKLGEKASASSMSAEKAAKPVAESKKRANPTPKKAAPQSGKKKP